MFQSFGLKHIFSDGYVYVRVCIFLCIYTYIYIYMYIHTYMDIFNKYDMYLYVCA